MSLASINIRFTTNLSEFSTAIQNQSRQIKKLGGQMESFGKGLTIGLTAPILAYGAASVLAFDQSAQAVAQVDAALKSTGGTVGYNSEQLQKMAADLQNISTFDDDEILKKATANLLTFSKITGTTFQNAQKAALDLATRLDGDLQSASIQVGKALQDPIKGVAALSKVGVSFSASQKETIRSMVETNNLAGAQSLILQELQKEFGGSAEAAGKAGAGPFKQLGNQIGDLSEEFGKIILDALQPFLNWTKQLISGFQALSPETKKIVVVVASFAAAIGPVVVGLGALLTVLPAIGTGLAALTGPVGLVIAGLAAIAVVVVTNWAPIKRVVVDIYNYFIDLYNSSTLFRAGIEAISVSFKNLWVMAKFAFNNIKAVAEFAVRNIFNYFTSLGKLIKAVLTFDVSGIKQAFKDGFGGAKESAVKLFEDVKNNSKETANEIKNNIGSAISNTLNGKQLPKIILPKDTVDAKAVKTVMATAIEEGAAQGAENAGKKITKGLTKTTAPVKLTKPQLPQEVDFQPQSLNIPYYRDQIDRYRELQDQFSTNNEEGRAKYQEYADKIKDTELIIQDIQGVDNLVESTNVISTTMIDLSEAIGEAVTQLAVNAAAGFGEAIGGVIAGTQSLGSIFNNMLSLVGNFMKDLGKTLIQLGIAKIAFDKLKISGPGAIIAGIALVALGSIVSAKFANAGKFADGGIVGGSSYYGDKILARVNSGELILNSAQQKSVLGAMSNGGGDSSIIPSIKIQGSDLLVVFDRANARKNRIG